MSRLSVKLEYEKKAAELRKLISVEAIKLQDVVDQKIFALSEINALSSRKTALLGVLAGLEAKIKEKKEELNQLIERELSFVSSIKTETDSKKKKLNDTDKLLEEKNKDLETLTKLSLELNKFIEKEGDIRTQYLKQKEKLEESSKEYNKIENKVKTEKEFLEIKNKELDSYKEYVINLYGKLASYVKTANDTIKFVNNYLEENGVPIEFKLPPGEIMEINFDNFNIKRTDT